MSTKIDKVVSDIEKTEKKITELQEQLKELYDKKTELENLEIVSTVRAMVMDKDGVLEFLKTMKSGRAKAVKASAPDKSETEDNANENE